ncbi:MAG: hypothetical protein ACREOU_13265, partial [Candidatus Eiseniibacteriota bacterium]
MTSRPRPTGRIAPCLLLPLLLLPAIVGAGCEHAPGGVALPNQRPQVRLTAAPRPSSETTYTVRLQWSAFDPDGQVQRFEYALDPPAAGDTSWTATRAHEVELSLPSTTPTDPLPPPNQRVRSRDLHTVALRAIDERGGVSAVVQRSFTSTTVAPESRIESPIPTNQQPVLTLPSVLVRFSAIDPDGVTRSTPVECRYRLVPATAIRPDAPEEVGQFDIQEYFGADLENEFAEWDSLPAGAGSVLLEGLTPQVRYFIAVVSRDEAGAWEPRFLLTSNVLQFRPVLSNLGPRITVSNEFFSRTQTAGGVSLDPSRIFTLEVPEGVPLTFHWTAQPNTGATVGGYRWALDLEGGDVTNERPRIDDDDFSHWSVWSVTEDRATIGPFSGSPDTTITHFLYVEARDNVGFVTLFTLRIQIVVPRFERDLLVIDDMFGNLSHNSTQPYPTEAEQDTFHFAVGGVPDRLFGGLSSPGAFADFAYDTLDYRFFGVPGMSLSLLGRYRVVAWYTDNFSSSGQGDLPYSSSVRASNALRYVNVEGRLNTLAVYLRQGGKLFLFGEGALPSVANGFWTRVSGSAVPSVPYSTSTTPARNYVLRPGCFLYDLLHMRSEMATAGTPSVSFTRGEQLLAALPYLPAFRGPASNTDRAHDPRIGPGAERTALKFPDLPRLTMANFRGANPDVTQRTINLTWYVSRSLNVTEGAGPNAIPVVDTLYLVQARDYSGDGSGALSDAHPNGLYYHGTEHGEWVWFGFPLYH